MLTVLIAIESSLPTGALFEQGRMPGSEHRPHEYLQYPPFLIQSSPHFFNSFGSSHLRTSVQIRSIADIRCEPSRVARCLTSGTNSVLCCCTLLRTVHKCLRNMASSNLRHTSPSCVVARRYMVLEQVRLCRSSQTIHDPEQHLGIQARFCPEPRRTCRHMHRNLL